MKTVKISDVCELIAGQSPPSNTYNDKGEGIPFFQGKTDFGYLFPIVRSWCTAPQKIAFPNDILISVRAPVGPTNINTVKSCIGRGLSAIRCTEKIDTKFLLYYLRSNEDKIAEKANGSTFSAITQKDLQQIQIPFPPLATQQKIAFILDAADAYRQKTKTLIEKYDQLAQSLFLDMFGDPQTNIKLWKTVEFGDHIDILTDYHANGSYENLNEHVDLKNTLDYALMIRTTDLERKNFEGDVICISESAYHFLKKTKVYGGEIIINKIGSAGKVYLMPRLNRPVSLGMNAFMLRLKSSLNHIFAYFLLKSQYGEQEIQKRVKGAVTKTIRKDAVRAIPIIVPPITLQNKFAERIQLIEVQKQKAQASLQKAEDLFNSLLQRAFKGELVEE